MVSIDFCSFPFHEWHKDGIYIHSAVISFSGCRRSGLVVSMSSNVMASAIFRSTSQYQLHSAQDAYNFSSCENVAFLLVKATFAVGSIYYRGEVEVI